MKTYFSKDSRSYDGSQLSPLFAFKNFGIEGESTVAWCGPCNVTNENMKDGEDLFAGESIAGNDMLHFIVEIFEQPLMAMVSLQRLLTCIVKEALEAENITDLKRDGDDIFFQGRKLSISIASRDAVSSMIHFALNITNEGTPVPTASLQELNLDPEVFCNKVLKMWESEFRGVLRATKKVFSL